MTVKAAELYFKRTRRRHQIATEGADPPAGVLIEPARRPHARTPAARGTVWSLPSRETPSRWILLRSGVRAANELQPWMERPRSHWEMCGACGAGTGRDQKHKPECSEEPRMCFLIAFSLPGPPVSRSARTQTVLFAFDVSKPRTVYIKTMKIFF
ncbi:hypothetical protein NDU88_007182 [Pleurodeles waltl]|uniref:Uncharacterized protein n=1 Tax=Pleurodeles waltl TaxID=8319 RepID=A0AAV7N3K5_PLEWA|nr:hypothetical protein NDU88_007182 [Pleurodeles waltl]